MTAESFELSRCVADISCAVTNARAIVELSIDHIDGGENLHTGLSALYGALSLLQRIEADVEGLEGSLMTASRTPAQLAEVRG